MADERADALTIAVLWLALVVGMVLHFNYDMSGLRYGVSVELPGADGTVPWSNFVIKALFYVVPFLLAVVASSFPGPAYRPVNFVLSLLFLLANASHVVVTARRATDVITLAQVLLLVAVLIANGQLSRVSYRWWRGAKSAPLLAAKVPPPPGEAI
jgi:hypothetical protein